MPMYRDKEGTKPMTDINTCDNCHKWKQKHDHMFAEARRQKEAHDAQIAALQSQLSDTQEANGRLEGELAAARASAKVVGAELVRCADEIRFCHTVDGEWDGSEEQAKEEYDRIMGLVTNLGEVIEPPQSAELGGCDE